MKNANIGSQRNVCLLTTAAVLNQVVLVSLNSNWLKTAYISRTFKVQFNKNNSQGLELISASVKIVEAGLEWAETVFLFILKTLFPLKNFQENQKLSFIFVLIQLPGTKQLPESFWSFSA